MCRHVYYFDFPVFDEQQTGPMPDLVIRPAVQDDLEVLWDFLAMAAYEPDAEAAKAVPRALILILSIGLQKRLVIAACPECGSGSHPTVNLRPITR